MSARQHERIEGRVREMVHSGEALVETAKGLVFSRFAAPGEKVVLSLDGPSGKVRRGRVLKVLEASPSREEPSCAFVQRCGGCPFMHLSIEAQRAEKQRFLREALVRAGAPHDLEVKLTAGTHPLAYRRRARLSYHVAGKVRTLGYLKERSRDVVDIDHCAVLDATLNAALTVLRETLLPKLAGEGEVLLARGKAGGAVLVLRTNHAQEPGLYAVAEQLVREQKLEGLALWVQGTSKPARFGDPEEWSAGLDGQAMEGTVGGFSQAQDEVNRLLAERVREQAKTEGARVLELYAGHGNFTVNLVQGAQSYLAIEQDREAVQALRKNLSARGLSAKVVEGDASAPLSGGAIDVVVLDPPRAGAKGVLERLLSRKVRRVVYVSCDPTTLGRDVAPLLSAGFALRWVEAFDMFPQTAELESLVVLER